MLDTTDQPLPASLTEAVNLATQRTEFGTQDRSAVQALIERYYRHVHIDDLESRAPGDLLGAMLSHRSLAERRPVGTAQVRVFNPTLEEHGWHVGHTVVEVVTDDMPFLVDTLTAELSRQNRPIHLVVHPIVVVRRDEHGNLTEVLSHHDSHQAEHLRDGEGAPEGAIVESWMHIEIDLESDPAEREAIRADLLRVLRDVQVSVQDWQQMRERALEVAAELEHHVPADLVGEAADAQHLLKWLADNHFTFIGYREYDLVGEHGEERLHAVKGSGLGILRKDDDVDSSSFDRLTPPVRAQARDRTVLILTKANSRSTVHRSVYLDYVGVKRFDDAGNVVGERRFLGLLTSAAYTQSVRSIPVIEQKVQQVMQRAGFAPGGHSDKDLQILLETYPRDELFQMSADELYHTAMSVMHLQERRQTRVYLRRDRYGRFVSCLVFLPRDKYTTGVRIKMQEILQQFFNAESVDFTTRLSESVLARLHFVARAHKGQLIDESFDLAKVEAELIAATETWEEGLGEAMRADIGEERTGEVLSRWAAFPEAYKENFDARLAVIDLKRLERLYSNEPASNTPASAAAGEPVDGLVMNLYQQLGSDPDRRRFKLYRSEPLSLTAVLPIFRNLGVEVTDERPHELRRKDGSVAYIYDFGIRCAPEEIADARERFTEAFAAAWLGVAETDGLDRLVLRAGLSWRDVVILRTFTKYLRQTGVSFSQNYIENALLEHRDIAAGLVELFQARFDPAKFTGDGERDAAQAAIIERLTGLLEQVSSLDSDRILRSLLEIIQATIRTNYYQLDADGQPKSYVSCKILPGQITDLPEPRPKYEIWVYGRRVEGVHLRFGDVARGGLRWSDRREDFRTEVLGLVKAQMVKNAVIVPTGSKGGFVAKQLPDPSVDRDAWFQEGVASYRTFISALLDITDNLGPTQADGTRPVVPPVNVVRHDGDDPYLVVAADKGTASFSDIANDVSAAYGFWLGDAFASGGSVGYDHKGMGITARGAWESVKRHFREMGHDTQTQEFTVVGIGDMSGDVFGNGMLLSEKIRLVAAFDHRHIFIDPNPDAAVSFAERQRLFEVPRSSWDDYNKDLISAGGGVFSRGVKSIVLTDQIKNALGIDPSIQRMTPNELMRAVLMAPVDLLWNGGIGTYVKSSEESNSQVGDRANDAIRLDGKEIRAKVVGEGGNLGCTQLGRIEAALNGVRINTDALDNSAGVDCSDHEVNIKIMFESIVSKGDLTMKQRNELLASMTDEVGELVLETNKHQNVLLGNARRQSPHMLGVHHRFIKSLEASGELDRALEFLPTDKQIEVRAAEGRGLVSPELCVLIAYSKISLENALLQTDVPSEPWGHEILVEYFPDELVERFMDNLDDHPLARQIIATKIVNEMVNRGGITFAYRAMEETGATVDEVVRAYVVSRTIFGMHEFMEQVDALPASVSTDTLTEMYLEFRRLLDRATRWFINNRPEHLDVVAEIAKFKPLLEQHRATMDQFLTGTEHDRLAARVTDLLSRNVPEHIARWEAGLLDAYSLLDIHGLVQDQNAPQAHVTQLYFNVSERYGFDDLLNKVSALSRPNRWTALARAALRDDLYAAMDSMTGVILEHGMAERAPGDDIQGDLAAWIDSWEQANSSQLQRVQATIDEVRALDQADLSAISVVLRQLRAMVKSAS